MPGQVQIVFNALINNDPRPFFMHQSNLTGDRLGYPVMDGVLSAYRAVYGPSAPIENLPTDQDGAVLRNQQLWAQARAGGHGQRLGAGQHDHDLRPARHASTRNGPGGDQGGIGGRGRLRLLVRGRAVGVHHARLAAAQARSRLGSVHPVNSFHPSTAGPEHVDSHEEDEKGSVS